MLIVVIRIDHGQILSVKYEYVRQTKYSYTLAARCGCYVSKSYFYITHSAWRVRILNFPWERGADKIRINMLLCIGGSRGCAGCTPPPMGPNSFVFAYIFTKKHLHQRSMPPPNRCTPPYGKSWIRHCYACVTKGNL